MTTDPTADEPTADGPTADERAQDREDRFTRFREYKASGSRSLRNALVEEHLDVAEYYVKRYRGRGVPPDDLRQVALLTIVRAVDRYDPDLGIEFKTFASRTIEGELKRYFRDRTWSVRPPRRAQELHLELRRLDEDMTQSLGRSPTVAELATQVGESVEHVLEALEAGGAHGFTSLDQPVREDDPSTTTHDRVLGADDPGYDHVDHRDSVEKLIATLPEREREVIRLRFYENLSQPEIAERIGVSQSYLSRVLRRTLVDLRAQLDDTPAPG